MTKVSKALINKLHEQSLHFFCELSKHPRGSGKEEKAADFLVDFAKARGLSYKRTTDIVNGKQTCTVIIYKPGTAGYEKAAPLILQAHFDMVCQKEPGSTHDFEKDPIEIIIEGNIMKANNTTLGADNGVGCGLMMTFLDSDEISHPPLEAVFTSDEEDGMSGIIAVTPDMLLGKRMINLDSNDEGIFTYGCAGGINCDIYFPVTYEATPEDQPLLKLEISNLMGGHSGGEIHKGRANSHLLLARILTHIHKNVPLHIAALQGGDKRNVIPRVASAIFAVPSASKEDVLNLITEMNHAFAVEYEDIELEMEISLSDASVDATVIPGKVLGHTSTEKVIALMMAVPNDVMAMHNQIEGLVGTSCNLGSILLDENEFRVLSSIRSAHSSKKDYMVDKFESIATLAGANFSTSGAYPGWKPNVNSVLMKTFKEIYEATFTDKKPEFEAIHAGLECGFISEKIPGIDIISCGPRIEDLHSPQERLYIDTLPRVVELLLNVMLTMKE